MEKKGGFGGYFGIIKKAFKRLLIFILIVLNRK